MSTDLRNRDWLKISDFTAEEVLYLLDLAAQLKAAKYRGSEGQALQGKNIALIFEKTSTRTRCAFEVAAYDQGAHVTYLGLFFSSRRRHTRFDCDWSSDVCSSD